jgi:DNA-binding transcriptional LysR family regulator
VAPTDAYGGQPLPQKLRPAADRRTKTRPHRRGYELGFNIFVRNGRTLTEITPAGQQVVAHALRILREAQSIKCIGRDASGHERAILFIGTTHTRARYVLPSIIEQFRLKYPQMQLHLHQGTSEQIAEMAKLQRLERAVSTVGIAAVVSVVPAHHRAEGTSAGASHPTDA